MITLTANDPENSSPTGSRPPSTWHHQEPPALDGNKPTALMAAYTFVGRNGWQLTASEEKAVVATQELASGEMTEKAFSAWMKQEPAGRP